MKIPLQIIWVEQSTTSCLVYRTQSVAKNVLFLAILTSSSQSKLLSWYFPIKRNCHKLVHHPLEYTGVASWDQRQVTKRTFEDNSFLKCQTLRENTYICGYLVSQEPDTQKVVHFCIFGFSSARHSESSTFLDIWFLKCRNWCDLAPGTTGPTQTSGKAVLAQGSRCRSGSACQIRYFNAVTLLLPWFQLL